MKPISTLIQLTISIFFLIVVNNVQAQCHDPKLNVVILGSGGPEMNDGRASSSYLFRTGNKALFLVDFGGGASLNFERSKANIDDLNAVLFSHFHVDHTADFPALIKAYYFQSRQTDLPILGPSGNEIMPSVTTWLQDLFGKKHGAYRYLSEFIDDSDSDSDFKLTPIEITADRKHTSIVRKTIAGFKISAISVTHGPIPALAYRIDINGCSVTFSGDTSNQTKTLEKLAMNTDLLIAHNAVPENSQDKIALNLHMPPSEIGRIAAKAKVKKVVLSHFMQRTEHAQKATLRAIRKRYNGPVLFANDLDVYNLAKPK